MDFTKLRGAPYLEPLHKTVFEFSLVKAASKVRTLWAIHFLSSKVQWA
jgi:hypothetical protein